MASIGQTTRPGYVYDSATDTWIPIGIGPHTHASTDLSGVIANSIVDAKGDLITATADNTPARLAVGNPGETLVADSSASTGLRWQGNFAAGKNKILNSDFSIWQRGTSFAPVGNANYTSDRWRIAFDGTSSIRNITRQSFTPGTAPVAGYESQYFLRAETTNIGSSMTFNRIMQRIEDVRNFAGETVTLSFWAKADSARTVTADFVQNFGSGGSPSGTLQCGGGSFSVTTSWARYSVTVGLPSLSGKTFGTNNDSFLQLNINLPINATSTIDIWGVQVEAGSVATSFQTATGTLAGELAACMRYYQRNNANGNGINASGIGVTTSSSTQAIVVTQLPVPMRVTPTALDYANLQVADTLTVYAITNITIGTSSTNTVVQKTITSSGMTTYRPMFLVGNNTGGYIGLSAEL